MSSPIDFKSLYQQQGNEPGPAVKEIVMKAKQVKRKMVIKLLLLNILLLFTVVAVLWSVSGAHFKMWTTWIGTALVIIAIFTFIITYNLKMMGLFKEVQEVDNQAYLRQFLSIRKKQSFIQRKLISIYFILLSAGVFLYMIESTAKMDMLNRILSYVFFIAWMAFNWFYIRPRSIRKRQTELNEMIGQLEGLVEKS